MQAVLKSYSINYSSYDVEFIKVHNTLIAKSYGQAFQFLSNQPL